MNVKKMAMCAILIGLSYALSYVKIFGSIALDSLPAYLGGIIVSPALGALIGALGHLFTALTSGFPYGLLVHLITALCMALSIFCASKSFDRGLPLTKSGAVAAFMFVGTLMNGPFSVACLSPLLYGMMGGMPGLLSFTLVLTIASFANTGLAAAVGIVIRGNKTLSKMVKG